MGERANRNIQNGKLAKGKIKGTKSWIPLKKFSDGVKGEIGKDWRVLLRP